MDLRTTFLVLFSLFVAGLADINMHNPRGCNNRLNEAKRGRKNAKRLFDSQNNNHGGHNVGDRMYYYSGSYLPIQWAHQHSCGDQNNNCEVVIQYMCDSKLRDGKTTATIPDNHRKCRKRDCNSDERFGMHEDFDYYKSCKTRERNKGLFTSTQRLRGKTARFTRQERKGTRYGYECPEERDYYPYWHPSPWKDIAVLTNNAERCLYYKSQSENIKIRGYCKIDGDVGSAVIPNNKDACMAFKHRKAKSVQWIMQKPHGISPPDCVVSQWSRDNHQGNTIGGYFMSYNWTVPDINEDKCVVRIRYNISTGEYDGWDPNVNSKLNGKRVNVGAKLGLSFKQANRRGYILRNNPSVMIFNEVPAFRLRINVDTGNFGRTFQDRSHVFSIRKRPASLRGKKIHNINVRGKRGNIVQVYPSVEYDFVPNTLVMAEGDYVHFQWTGSDTNPRNNDGQGRRGTDRSNVILIRSNPNKTPRPRVYGQWSRNYPAKISSGNLLGLSERDLKKLATISDKTYFDLPPKMVKGCGTYHYMSTRNNAFSNRSQKGRIIVNSCTG